VKLFEVIFTHPYLHALGWALLHFLWQGALLALLLAGLLRLLRGRSANARYLAACAALLLMLVSPAVTFWRTSRQTVASAVDERSLAAARPTNVTAATGPLPKRADRPEGVDGEEKYGFRDRHFVGRLEALLPWLILAWMLGVAFLTARVFGGLFYTFRLTRFASNLLETGWQERLASLSKQLGLKRPVRLLQSALVQVPTTIGWLRPVILLPASALTGLTPQQLELILAHELSHIRRHDYLVNLFQIAAETLLFYHPAVWWVSRQVRIEREHACDDMAVALFGDPLAYARALTRIERMRRQKVLLAIAADGGKLTARILRLIENPKGQGRSSSPLLALFLAAAFITSLAFAHKALSPERIMAAPARGADSPAGEAVTRNGRQSLASVKADAAQLSGEMATLTADDDTEGEDEEVRRVALAALGERRGSVIVMDPRTGRVHTIVNQEWAVRRSWRPASVIKLVTGAAGVTEKLVQTAERVRVQPQSRPLNFTEALALSDNSYFSLVGQRVGSESLIRYAREFGLGQETGINHPGESTGRLPLSQAVSDSSRLGAYAEGIEATPIQLAILVSAIANGGTLVVPRVPRTGQESVRFEPQVRRRLSIPLENLESLRAGMIGAVDYGTGKAAFDPAQSVAGKTGTFQDDREMVGLFVSYAPAENPRLVVVVLTRGQNESGPLAASVAGAIYRALKPRA
jgi:beta-lactamase regulating signal transducer with metallopeptidase domain